MARVLQVQDSSVEPLSAVEASEFPMSGTVAVFDPAMCCETGLCGPGVDPELLRIARDLRWLSAQGVTVHRAGLSQEPQAFVASTKVQGLMQAFGDGALPAVLVDGAVLTYGRYPTRDELVAVLTPAPATEGGADAAGSCCTPGSGCC
jgi:Arsenical resistance operon protein ArsD